MPLGAADSLDRATATAASYPLIALETI